MCFSLLANEAYWRRIVWTAGQLSNRLHGGPAATLAHAESSSHQTGNEHFKLSPAKFAAEVCLEAILMKKIIK